MADQIGTVRVELIADPSGVQQGIEQAGAALTRFAAIGTAVGTVIANAFTSMVSHVLGTFGELAQGTGEIWDQLSNNSQNAVTLVVNAWNKVGEATTSLTASLIDRLAPAFAVLVEQISGISAAGTLSERVFNGVVWVLEQVIKVAINVVAQFRDIMVSIETMGAQAYRLGQAIGEVLQNIFSPTTAAEAWRRGMADIGQINNDAAGRIMAIWQDAAKRIAEINEGIRITGERSGPPITPWQTIVRGSTEARDHLRQLREEMQVTLHDSSATYEDRLIAIANAYDAGAISFGKMQRALQDLAKSQIQAANSALTSVGNALVAVFNKSKPAAIAQALINTYTGITSALAAGYPPWNTIQAAAIGAMGFAQVRNIMSTNASGGGSVPSTSVGTGDAGAGMPSQMLMVEGLSGSGLASMTSVRDLAERLLQYQKDGGVVVLK